MQTPPARLRELVAAREPYVAERVFDLVQQNALGLTREYSQLETQQMVRGLLSVLVEELEGDARTTREFFLESVLPNMVAEGIRLEDVVGPAVGCAIAMATDFVLHAPDAARAETTAQIARFWSLYIKDLLRAWNKVAGT